MQERQAIDKAVRVDKVAAAEAARRIDAARRRAGRPVTSDLEFGVGIRHGLLAELLEFGFRVWV